MTCSKCSYLFLIVQYLVNCNSMQYAVQTHSLTLLFFKQAARNKQTMLYYVMAFFINTRKGERIGHCWLKMRWMGTHGVQIKGIRPWLVRWACRAGKRDFSSALAALVCPLHNIFLFPHQSPYTISVHFSPSSSKLGRKSCWVACLLVCVSG
jgi:hypothetical protein